MSIDYFIYRPLKLWFDLALFFLVFIAFVVLIYLAYRRLDEMEDLLNKCSLITPNQRVWGNSIRGRMIRLSAVTAAVVLPRWNVKRGAVDLQQVQAFPRNLKRLLQGTLLVGVLFLMSATADILYKWLHQ
jgi:hypothetical protein